MKWYEVLGLGVAGVIVYNLITKVISISNIIVSGGGVNNITFQNGVPVISFYLTVQNTSSQPLTVNSFVGNVSQVTGSGSILIGAVSSFVPQTVLPNTQGQLQFNAALSLIGAVTDIVQSFNTGNVPQTLNITGIANADNLQVPINTNFNL